MYTVQCRDLVSFETPREYKMFEEVMIAGKWVQYKCFRDHEN